jgi:CBS domain-containing protein
MKVRECMTRDVAVASLSQTLADAARIMAELNIGSLPVATEERLIGMVTDRDIVVRAIANGKGPDTPIREVMSDKVLYCYDDQTIDEVARNMGETQVRRLPVVNRDKRLVGIISLGDVSKDAESAEPTAHALREISETDGERTARH